MRIALGVSGGIAAYKACEVLRGLQRAGAEVHVILTRAACRFVTPLTFQALSGRPVFVDPFDPEGEQAIRHVLLARDLSALVVAPATANLLAKFAHGVADDFLTTFYTAVTAPVVLAPAMNTRMWLHPATQANLAALRSRAVRIVEPESGWLAEGEVGWGRLAEPARIVEATLAAARRSTELAGKKILVTAGPTREPLDPVRYLSNRSSGKMGYALAEAAARRGARVVLVSGPVGLAPPFGVEVVPVVTAGDMREAVLREARGAAAVFMAAAVSDYVPTRETGKIKRTGAPRTIVLEEAPDILAELGRLEGERPLLVGFAAETENLLEEARRKLVSKKLDFVVANDVSRPGIGFEADRNEVTILGRSGTLRQVPEGSKLEVAEAILDEVFGRPE